MKTIRLLIVIAALAGVAATSNAHEPTRVLLLGNSIIYTNNLPAVLHEIASAGGHQVEIDMFSRGGAQIADLVASPVVATALSNTHYEAVFFHDRGGDAFCAGSATERESDNCTQMMAHHATLAERIRATGAEPYLLGTYQPEHASARLVAGEKAISRHIDTAYIEISDSWNRIRALHPELPWFAEDGLHPGRALTTLMALRIHEALFGELPPASQGVSTPSPLYVPRDAMKKLVRHGTLATDSSQEVLSHLEFSALVDALQTIRLNENKRRQ